MLNTLERFQGCLLGLAVGDAVGTRVEFNPRGSFTPVTDMLGGGPFRLELGQWTDDTSMALCLASSLVERGEFDAADQMQRYCNWYLIGQPAPIRSQKCKSKLLVIVNVLKFYTYDYARVTLPADYAPSGVTPISNSLYGT